MFSLQSWLLKLRESRAPDFTADLVTAPPPLARFAAMPKLVDEQELTELANLPGLDSRLLQQLRSQRRRAYRLYLAELIAEFQVFEKEALNRAANDPAVDPGFAGEVLKVKARFMVSVWLLRASLWLPAIALTKTHQWTIDLVGAYQPVLPKPS